MKISTLVSFVIMQLAVCLAIEQSFVLVNKTGINFYALYISPAEEDNYGEDLLDADILQNGKDIEIKFSNDNNKCKWDFMIEDENGDSYYWKGIDLCKHNKIILHYENGKTRVSYK